MSDDVAQASPDIVRALSEMEPIVFAICLATYQEFHTSCLIRLVLDFLAEFLSKNKTVESRYRLDATLLLTQ